MLFQFVRANLRRLRTDYDVLFFCQFIRYLKPTKGDPSVVCKQVQYEVVDADGDASRGYIHSGHVEHDRSVRVVHLEVVHSHDETVTVTN